MATTVCGEGQTRQTKDVGNWEAETKNAAVKNDNAFHLREGSLGLCAVKCPCTSPETSLREIVAMLPCPLPKGKIPGLSRKE